MNSGKHIDLGAAIRSQFPVFSRYTAERPLHYLDSAASSFKPKVVIDRIANYLSFEHANIHRGAYELSAKATENYDEARHRVARFINASFDRSIVFTKGATQGINLVARALESRFNPGDTILLTLLEHHSNIVPWQLLAKRRNLKIEFVAVNQDASLNLQDLEDKVKTLKPRMLAFTAVSNAFGTVTDIEQIIRVAKASSTFTLIDASQAVMHRKIDVTALDVDFLVFTGHKLYGPTGIGVLYGREELLSSMDPYEGGGDMIQEVTVSGSTWAEIPRRFEAGTPPIAEAIGLGAAITFIEDLGIANIAQYEGRVFNYGFGLLSKEMGVTVYGPALSGKAQAPIIPFTIAGVHPHDMATIADKFNVQIRAGHHCAMPLMRHLKIQATARASIGVYSEESDFDALVQAIREARRVFAK